jgi:hypothetical protein
MRAFAVSLLLVSAPVLACPNLAGTYATCRSLTGQNPGQTDMIVTQKIQNKITTYDVSAINNETNEREYETYKADGRRNTQVITDEESGMTLETSSLITCTTKALNIRFDMKLDGYSVGYQTISVAKVGNQLIIDSKSFDGDETIIEKEICE